ncbi:MAG TPA: hypothetical protein VGN08_13600 [Solirubrobacteraceae bacterium]|jgi:hypothetical protein
MPRDVTTPTPLVLAAATNTPAGTAITPSNGGTIAGANDGSHLVLRITNTSGSERPVTIKAGVNPPAVRAGLGSLVVNVPATTGDVTFMVESTRHCQADGSVLVDYETGHVGKLICVLITKAA